MREDRQAVSVFRPQGLDLSSPFGITEEGKSPYSVNLWRDYSDTSFSGLQTRPGMSLFKTFEDKRTAEKPLGGSFYIVPFGDGYVYKKGTGIYYSEQEAPLYEGLSDEVSSPEETAFRYALYNNSMYIYELLSGNALILILTFKEGAVSLKTVTLGELEIDSQRIREEYCSPTVMTGLNSKGVGKKNLPFNLLSPYYSLEYVSEVEEDGTRVMNYSLPTKGTPVAVEYTHANGSYYLTFDGFTFKEDRRVIFISDLMPNTEFKVYMFDIGRKKEREKILKMKKFTVFDNRVFAAVTEDEENKNRLFWSRAENPLYWADTDFVTDGQGGECVTAILPVGQYLSVFKKDRSEKNGIYLHYPTETKNELVPKVYPSVYGLYDVGVVNENSAVNVSDNCLFLSRNGLNTLVGTELTKVSSVGHLSSAVDAKLLSELRENEAGAKVVAFRDYVLISVGSVFYLGDTKSTYLNLRTGQRELNWYKWYNVRPWSMGANGTGGKRSCRLLQLFEDNEGFLCAVFYENNFRWLVRFDNLGKDRADVVLSCNPNHSGATFPIYSALATGYGDFGFPDRRKRSLRRSGSVTAEGEEISVFSKTDWEKRAEPEFLNRSKITFIPYVKTDGGRPVTAVKRKGLKLFYDLYTPDFLSLSVLYQSFRPLNFYEARNGAKIREKER